MASRRMVARTRMVTRPTAAREEHTPAQPRQLHTSSITLRHPRLLAVVTCLTEVAITRPGINRSTRREDMAGHRSRTMGTVNNLPTGRRLTQDLPAATVLPRTMHRLPRAMVVSTSHTAATKLMAIKVHLHLHLTIRTVRLSNTKRIPVVSNMEDMVEERTINMAATASTVPRRLIQVGSSGF